MMMARKKRRRTQVQGKVANTSAECAPQDELRGRVKGRSTLHEISTAQGAEFRAFFRWLATNRPDDARSWPAEYARRFEIIAAVREREMDAAKQAFPENPEDATHEQLAALCRAMAEFDIASCVTRHAWEVDERLRDLPQVDAVILEAALVEIDDFMRQISFRMRHRIHDPLFPGHNTAMLLDLAGLLAPQTHLYPDLRRALGSGGADPTEEKYRLLPAAVYEKTRQPEAGETLDRIRNRVAYALQELGDGDMPRREKQVIEIDEDGKSALKVKKYDAELSSGLGRSSEDDDAPDQLSRIRYRQRGNDPSSDSDGFSDHALDLLELGEVIERASPTPRQLDMLKRRAVLGETSNEVADNYDTTTDNVDATVSQTRAKLRAAREDIRHPKKPPT